MRPSRVYMIAAGTALALIAAAWISRDKFRPVGPGVAAPTFAYPSLEGDTLDLADYRGKVVLVNLWATWCAPCRSEMPSMQRLYEEMKDRPFEILAVNVDARFGEVDVGGRPGGDVPAFVSELGLTFPILLNPAGEIQREYQTTGLPESFLVGPDGVIRRKVAGGTNWDQLAYREQIERMLTP
ncbi:MAG: TlpA disulfide reductase family protein [Gemmatimonadota bacterium]